MNLVLCLLYTDPGSGILLWQILVGGAAGVLFYWGKIRLGIRRVFKRLWRAE